MISVIIPNYNYAQFLRQRIDTVLNQTYQDIELIILDDCSNDYSKEIIETYRSHHKVTQIVYNTTNSGSTFKQWQKGISLAKGEYIWIAESDDWAEPDFLERTFAKFKDGSEIGLVYANSKMYVNEILTTTLSDIKMNILENYKWKSDYIHEGKYEISDSLALCCSINNASAVLFKKDVLLKASPFDIEFKFLGDWYCYLKVAYISKIAYINQTLNNYRDHTSNVSKKATINQNHLKEFFQIFTWILQKGELKDKKHVLEYFDGYTKNDLWIFDHDFRKIFPKLIAINYKLFIHMIVFKIVDKTIPFLKKYKKVILKFQ